MIATDFNHATPHEQWRQWPLRRACVQYAWDARSAGRDRHPDDRELDDERWAALCEWRDKGGLIASYAQLRNVEAVEGQKKIASAQPALSRLDFIKALFAHTEGPTYVCSFTNERDEGPERHTIGRSSTAIDKFLSNWDKPGRGAFVCVGTLKAGAQRRAKENIAQTTCLHADIDFKDLDTLGEDPVSFVMRYLARLKYLPSITVLSGGGVHCYWLLREPVDTQAEMERIEAALRQLADVVAGDLVVCEVSRVMRLPGSHNSKEHIGWQEVEIVELHPERRYELDDLEEWFGEQTPVMLRKTREHAKTVGEIDEFKWFEDYGKRHGIKAPIDVEKRLAGMMYMGTGDSSIHQTQLAVTASMLNHGVPVDEVVDEVLKATMIAAGDYGKRWNWQREVRKLRGMCATWLKKHPVEERKPKPKLKLVEGSKEVEQQGATAKAATADGGNVVQLPTSVKIKKDVPAVVVGGLINAIRRDGRDIMLAEGEVWIYEEGVWHIMTPAEEQWLRSLIQIGFDALNEPKKTSALNNCWKLLVEHPELFKRKVEWADAKVIVCANGVLDIETRELHPHAPHWFARRKITTNYVVGAACPKFLELLTSMFSLHASPQAAISMYQEWLGAALAITRLTREQRKALMVVGKSRTGKSELSNCARILIGEPIASPAVSEISETFGMMNFIDAMAWIRDDAVNEGDTIDPQRFKVIVTGEPVSIRRMNQKALNTRLNIPVMLTANSLPHARDHSDAVYNRCIVLRLDKVVTEREAVEIRVALGVPVGHSIGSHIMETEASGVLNWALDGLARLLERGSFDLPPEVAAAVREFKEGNNPVAEFARIAIKPSPHFKVERGDVLCAYHGWQREEEGEEARAKGARSLFPKLRSVFDGDTIGNQKSGDDRFLTGFALTDEGLRFWDLHRNGQQLKNGSPGRSPTKGEVNRICDVDAGDAKPDGDMPF
jgi:P4 family phage/plasmid primase-like protien